MKLIQRIQNPRNCFDVYAGLARERESKYCWSAAHCKTSHPQMQILLTWDPTRQKTQKLYESQIIPQIYFLSFFGAKPKGRREEMERYQSKYSSMRIQSARKSVQQTYFERRLSTNNGMNRKKLVSIVAIILPCKNKSKTICRRQLISIVICCLFFYAFDWPLYIYLLLIELNLYWLTTVKSSVKEWHQLVLQKQQMIHFHLMLFLRCLHLTIAHFYICVNAP